MKKQIGKEYLRVTLIALFGGLAGSIPFLISLFYYKLTASPFYLITGAVAYVFYIYFMETGIKKKKYLIFVILGILLAVSITQVIGFSFDPAFTKLISNEFKIYEKSSIILINNYKTMLLAILLYFIIALIGLFITHVITKLSCVDNSNNRRNRKNARKKY